MLAFTIENHQLATQTTGETDSTLLAFNPSYFRLECIHNRELVEINEADLCWPMGRGNFCGD